MKKDKYYIEGTVSRELCDKKMAHFLLFVEPNRLIYNQYSYSTDFMPDWDPLIMATTVYDYDENSGNEQNLISQPVVDSGYKSICLDYFEGNEEWNSKRVPDDYRYYFQHLINYFNRKNRMDRNGDIDHYELHFKEYDRRVYKRTEVMANFILYEEDLVYLKDDFIEAARKSREDMQNHIIWTAICCIRHNFNCQPNPDKFVRNANNPKFTSDQLDLMVEKRKK